MKDLNPNKIGYYNSEFCNLNDFLEIINQKLTDGSFQMQGSKK